VDSPSASANNSTSNDATSASKKFSDIFFFGKPKREASSLFFSNNDEIVNPIGRPRTGSFSSTGSAIGPTVQPPSQNDFFSPWKDDQGSLRAPTLGLNHSNAGSVLSLDKTPGTGTSLLDSGWSVFDGNQSSGSQQQQWQQGMPSLLVTDSAGSSNPDVTTTPSTPSKRSMRGFAGLFTSDAQKDSQKSRERSIASLFGKSDDSASSDGLSTSMESRESGFAKDTFLQKSTRMFTGGYRRSVSNSSSSPIPAQVPPPKEKGSGGSSKFVRRLSLFGKKGEKMEENLDDLPEAPEGTIAEDTAAETAATNEP
jgi:hypothetical protein